MRQKDHYGEVMHCLQQLKKSHPSYTIAQHLSTALDDYGNFWGLSDKEMLYALDKYKAELEYDFFPDPDIDNIIEQGKDLFSIEEDDDGS